MTPTGSGPDLPPALRRIRAKAARRRRPSLTPGARRLVLVASASVALAAPLLLPRHTDDARRPPGGPHRARRPAPLVAAPSAPTAGAAAPRPAPRPPPVTVSSAPCPPVTGDALDTDGDGCEEAMRVEAGTVEVAGTRYVVGGTGDQVVAGDWDCDGRDTLALFRPATGEVFAFAGWAAPGADLTVAPVATVAAAEHATAGADDVDGDGCDEIVLARPGAAPAVVRLVGPTGGAAPPRWPATVPPP